MTSVSGILFQANALAEHLNDITNVVTTSAENLNNPSPSHVQRLYFEALLQLGYSTILQTHVPPKLRDLPTNEFALLKDNLPVDKILVAGRLFFSTVPDCDFKFGIKDLVDPKPLRTRKFLSVLVNFWLLCNNKYDSVTKVQEKVKMMADQRKELEANIEKYKRMIMDNRQSKVQIEIDARKLEADYSDLSVELQRKIDDSNDLKALIEQEKENIKILEHETGLLRKELEDLSTFEKRLRLLIHSDETKKTLQEDLIKADNEFTSQIQQQETHHQRLAAAEQKESEVFAFLDSYQSLSELISVVQNLTDEVKGKEKGIELARQSMQTKDEKLAEMGKMMNNLKMDISSARAKWSKKRSCMEEELQDYKDKLGKVRQEITEEDIVSADLESHISKIKVAISEHEKEFKRTIQLHDEKCKAILSCLEYFTNEMKGFVSEIVSEIEGLEKYNP